MVLSSRKYFWVFREQTTNVHAHRHLEVHRRSTKVEIKTRIGNPILRLSWLGSAKGVGNLKDLATLIPRPQSWSVKAQGWLPHPSSHVCQIRRDPGRSGNAPHTLWHTCQLSIPCHVTICKSTTFSTRSEKDEEEALLEASQGQLFNRRKERKPALRHLAASRACWQRQLKYQHPLQGCSMGTLWPVAFGLGHVSC